MNHQRINATTRRWTAAAAAVLAAGLMLTPFNGAGNPSQTPGVAYASDDVSLPPKVVGELTTLQQQLLVLQEELTELRIQTQQGTVPLVSFPSVGALVRSIPDERIVRNGDSELSRIAGRRWLMFHTKGRAMSVDLIVNRFHVRTTSSEIELHAAVVVEPHRVSPVKVQVICVFDIDAVENLADLRRGDRLRVHGVIAQAGFLRNATRKNSSMFVDLNYCSIQEQPAHALPTIHQPGRHRNATHATHAEPEGR